MSPDTQMGIGCHFTQMGARYTPQMLEKERCLWPEVLEKAS